MACVLVVEDEVKILNNIARSLGRSGFEVVTAGNCEHARSAFEGRRIDALCVDIVLPDGDGLDLLAEFRETAPDLPVVVMSAEATMENRVRVDRLSTASFLSKPFSLADLKRTLVRFLVST